MNKQAFTVCGFIVEVFVGCPDTLSLDGRVFPFPLLEQLVSLGFQFFWVGCLLADKRSLETNKMQTSTLGSRPSRKMK